MSKTREISIEIRLRIFISNVKSVLLYGCEIWKVTKRINHKGPAKGYEEMPRGNFQNLVTYVISNEKL